MGLPRESVKPFDPDTPSVARVWDYWLGGKNNFPADRELAEKMLEINPLAAQMARDNRQFLGRAVSYVASRGVRQFIDVGAGLPTAPNTHDSVQQADPGAKVAYVDNDPIVIAHARVLLAMTRGVVVVSGDMRDPATILADAQLTSVIDIARPVCVLLSGVLHFLDADPARAVATAFTRAVAPGSYVIISVGTGQDEVATSPPPTRRPLCTSTAPARSWLSSTAWNWCHRAWYRRAPGIAAPRHRDWRHGRRRSWQA